MNFLVCVGLKKKNPSILRFHDILFESFLETVGRCSWGEVCLFAVITEGVHLG